MNRPVLPLLFLIVALVLCWPRLVPQALTQFTQVETIPPHKSKNVIARDQLLPKAGSSAHAVTLAQTGAGKLIAVWYSGSREGGKDVAIYCASYDQGVWSDPQVIIDRAGVERGTQRLIRKLGNPLLWRAPDNTLHLWFVSVSNGGWAGSAINHMESIDGGMRWSRIDRIITSPFWNLSTLVRNPPLALADGGIALPVYHEFLYKRPEWLRFDKNLMLIDKSRVPGSAGTLQPAVVSLSAHNALMLLRDAGPSHRIQAARSENAGVDWHLDPPLFVDNSNSAIALIRLADGSLLLACNPQASNRNRLALLRSVDAGHTWSMPHIVESGADADEFSYPALLQDEAGTIHLAYTWKRQAIKHVVVPFEIVKELR